MMTLLELLVQELPKLGGWPEGYAVASNGLSGKVVFHCGGKPPFVMAGLDFNGTGSVLFEGYQAALTASKQPLKPLWSGYGIPPAGVHCEIEWCPGEWYPCKIVYVGKYHVIVEGGDESEYAYEIDKLKFRQGFLKGNIEKLELDEVAKPVIKWINGNANPHAIIVIDGTSAVLYSGEKSVLTEEYIKD